MNELANPDARGTTVALPAWRRLLWLPAVPTAGVVLIATGTVSDDDAVQTWGIACLLATVVASWFRSAADLRAGRASPEDERPRLDPFLRTWDGVLVFGGIFAAIGGALWAGVVVLARWKRETSALADAATGACVGAGLGFGAILLLALFGRLRRFARRALAAAPGAPVRLEPTMDVSAEQILRRGLAAAAAGAAVAFTSVAVVRDRPLLYVFAAAAALVVAWNACRPLKTRS